MSTTKSGAMTVAEMLRHYRDRLFTGESVEFTTVLECGCRVAYSMCVTAVDDSKHEDVEGTGPPEVAPPGTRLN